MTDRLDKSLTVLTKVCQDLALALYGVRNELDHIRFDCRTRGLEESVDDLEREVLRLERLDRSHS